MRSGSDKANMNWIVQDNVMLRTPSGSQDTRETVFSKLPVLVVPTDVRILFWKRHEQGDDVCDSVECWHGAASENCDC